MSDKPKPNYLPLQQPEPNTVAEALALGQSWEKIFYPAGLATFGGRFLRLADMCNFPQLFYSYDYIRSQKKLLSEIKNKEIDLNQVTTRQARKANSVVTASVHPQTGDIIPPLLRMAFQLPYNVGMCSALMMAVGNVPATIFFHWCNQTYNVCLNYTHRNASSENSNTRLAISYAGAVTTSLTAALGLVPLVNKLKVNPATKNIILKASPLFALSVANLFNISFMRSAELMQGIALETAEGEYVGRSKTAAYTAIGQTVISRVLANFTPMTIPNIVVELLRQSAAKTPDPAKTFSKRKENSIFLLLVFLNFWYSFPVALAIFPQTASLKTSALEPELRHIVSPSTGKPVEYVYFQKGL